MRGQHLQEQDRVVEGCMGHGYFFGGLEEGYLDVDLRGYVLAMYRIIKQGFALF